MPSAARAPRPKAIAAWLAGGLMMLAAAAPAFAAETAQPGPRWGAIATADGLYGYAFNHTSRAAAENAARTQCERRAGKAGGGGACEVRLTFDRACGAMATGNYSEWGVASAPTMDGARKEAVAQCNAHLPTEPCKVLVSVCSTGG